MTLQIKKLSKELLNDYLHFFDDIAICDNPEWSRCYCTFYYLLDEEITDDMTKEVTRNCIKDRIERDCHSGYLAFVDNEPVGWINAGIKENYVRVMDNKDITYDKNNKVASIVCFVVDKNHRGKGIATALLNEACKDFKFQDYDYVEAYPRKSPENDAENYHGPMTMYLKSGFIVNQELDEINVVRKYLK